MIVLKDFDYTYSAVNARLKTSNNKHLINLTLKSSRVKTKSVTQYHIGQSRYKRIYCRLCVCTKAKKYWFSRFLFYIFWKEPKFQLNLLSRRSPQQKTEEFGSFSKFEKVSFNICSRDRAAYGSVRNLGKASGLLKRKVELNIKIFVLQSDVSEARNISMKFGVWTWLSRTN